MAHKVETMAYAGETPWHGLGEKVSNDLTPAQMAIKAKLNWTMEKLPVKVDFKGEIRTVPGKYNLTRMTDGFVMDVVSDLYKHVQPEQALDFFKKFVEAGHMEMNTAGSLDHGRRIWALASIKASFTLKGGDKVEGYLLLCSPNKAGEALTIKFCATRVVCNNTITMALAEGPIVTKNGEKTKTVRLNHLQEFTEARQKEALDALNIAVSQMDQFQKAAELMASKKAERQAVLNYVASVSGSKILTAMVEESEAKKTGSLIDSIVATSEAIEVAQKVITEDDLNRVGKTILQAIIDSPGAELKSAKGTWWGALNGVTYAIDHQLGKVDTRLNSAWYGEKETMKKKALDLAVEYATAQTGRA